MEYRRIDYIDVEVADSFVKKNKIGIGNGEARLYIGAVQKRDWNLFFNNFNSKAFLRKSDLLDYLNKCKFEYEEQSQEYKEDISNDWFKYYKIVNEFPSEFIYFNIYAANGEQDNNRFYIRSDDEVFKNYFRSLLLPIITTLRIAKVVDNNENILFYFYPYLNSHELYNHPTKIENETKKIEEDKEIKTTQKEQLILSRIGQGKFRSKVISVFNRCIITTVDDERLLIAGHIKPWAVCNNEERLDEENGVLFTPTYDKLFDLGFITFDNQGKLIISNHISDLNIEKLKLCEGKKYIMEISSKKQKYLTYHQNEVFKK